MRNALLTITILFCLATASAADRKKAPQPQPNQAEQTQVARNDASESMAHASSMKNDCMPKTEKQPKNMHDDPEGDPEASQNRVEYGGGG